MKIKEEKDNSLLVVAAVKVKTCIFESRLSKVYVDSEETLEAMVI